MKKIDFLKITDEIVEGREVIVRYFTHHKRMYADIIGIVNNMYGVVGKNFNGNGYHFTIKLTYVDDPFNIFEFYNNSNIKFFSVQDERYCHLYSNQIISIKTGSLMSFKLKKIKENIKH